MPTLFGPLPHARLEATAVRLDLLRVHDGDSNRIQILRILGTDWTATQNTVFHDPLKLISWTFAGALAESHESDELVRNFATPHQLIALLASLLRLFQNTTE